MKWPSFLQGPSFLAGRLAEREELAHRLRLALAPGEHKGLSLDALVSRAVTTVYERDALEAEFDALETLHTGALQRNATLETEVQQLRAALESERKAKAEALAEMGTAQAMEREAIRLLGEAHRERDAAQELALHAQRGVAP